jgi:flavin-dependent dehydrogenase
MNEIAEVAIIGAGPSGTIAGALLKNLGHQVVILEQNQFPRFSIGESLLPYCMEFVEQAGMSHAVKAEGFQCKNGAVFVRDGKKGSFDFRDKFSPGPGTTFQVPRARFDQLLAEQAEGVGVDIRYGEKLKNISFDNKGNSILAIEDEAGNQKMLTAKFLLDASGFGRVLPRLLDLEMPSDFPVRQSIFTHIEDNILDTHYDREKILIAIHPQAEDVWYWLIPFSNGRCSLGVVAEPAFFEGLVANTNHDALHEAIAASPDLSMLLMQAVYDTPVQSITGYSSNVKSLWGKNYALLGNAGEFLDPVFSSGVTIAMKSASLAAPLVSKQLRGELVDWQKEYSQQLKKGVDTFRTYVKGWYQGDFQQIVFADNQEPAIRAMVSSILAGYAWDTNNPFVQESERRLKVLAEICATD